MLYEQDPYGGNDVNDLVDEVAGGMRRPRPEFMSDLLDLGFLGGRHLIDFLDQFVGKLLYLR
jgi:hypothetical protein